MKIKWKSGKKSYWITPYVTTVTWSGADTQASRSLEFEMVNTPYDPSMKIPAPKGGDIVVFYDDNDKARFAGRITGKSRLSEVGTKQFTARDYMHNMINSKASYKFKKKTPEYITKAVCKDIGVKVGALVKTKKKLKKFIVQGESIYDIIRKAYKKAKTGKSYMLTMNGTKFTVVKKGGTIANFHLDSTKDILNMEYTENADSMINQIAIYNKNGKKIGVVKNAGWIKLYGAYQDVLDTDGKNKKANKKQKSQAKKQMQGVDKKTTLEAIGDIKCVSGRAVTVLDRATNTSAEFWIKSDSHTWENGIHTMTLELKFRRKVKSTVTSKASGSGTAAAKADAEYDEGEGNLGWPCTGTTIKGYVNQSGSAAHTGIDIKVPAGTQIHAAEAGTVCKVGKNKTLGKHVVISHDGGLKTTYGNCSAVTVKQGKTVDKGDVIAKAGSTGDAAKAQCHFGVQSNNVWKNPSDYLR